MGLIEIAVKNELVSEDFWDDLLLIDSTIPFKLIFGTQTKNIPTLDEVDEVETVSTCHAIQLSHFCFSFHSGQNYFRHNYQ